MDIIMKDVKNGLPELEKPKKTPGQKFIFWMIIAVVLAGLSQIIGYGMRPTILRTVFVSIPEGLGFIAACFGLYQYRYF